MAVVLSGFQWTIWRIYTTLVFYRHCRLSCFIRISMNNLKDIHNTSLFHKSFNVLFYQDFNEQFEGYTQHSISMSNLSPVVLSGFQWTIWRIYTTAAVQYLFLATLFYQDFNEQFEGYTQSPTVAPCCSCSCFIRISMNNLKDIHNWMCSPTQASAVVLSGFQWTIWRIYTTLQSRQLSKTSCFIRISMNNLKDIHNQ